MSTVTASATRERADLRHASRVLAAVILPIGPAAVALLRYLLPYTTATDSRDAVARVEADQVTQSAVVWLGFVACFALVPGVIFAGRAVGRAMPRLAAAATVLLVVGYLSLPWIGATDAYLLLGIREGLPADVLVSIYEGGVHPSTSVALALFVLGHVLGTILLGVAMLRGRVVPVWAAIATIVSQPIHFVAAVIIPNHTLDLVGWGLNAVGFAALSLVILRMNDDEWGPAPRR